MFQIGEIISFFFFLSVFEKQPSKAHVGQLDVFLNFEDILFS